MNLIGLNPAFFANSAQATAALSHPTYWSDPTLLDSALLQLSSALATQDIDYARDVYANLKSGRMPLEDARGLLLKIIQGAHNSTQWARIGEALKRISHAQGGLPTSEICLDSLQDYRRLSQQQRTTLLLSTAYRVGGIPTQDPSWLGFSPFGWHGSEFLTLLEDPSLPFRNPSRPLRIASYGAGFHNDFRYLNAAAVGTGHPPLDEKDPRYAALIQAQRALFAPIESTSYEPREVLALFLSGRREGELHVFDNQPEVALHLRRPNFAFLNIWGSYSEQPPLQIGKVSDYWRDYVSSGRDAVMRIHSLDPSIPLLYSSSFLFTPDEMRKLYAHTVDIICDPIPVPEPFDLSIWLEGWYFIPIPLVDIAWAKVVFKTKKGGFILTDIPTLSPHALESMGLCIEGRIENTMSERKTLLRTLYRKIAETKVIQDLAAI